MYNKQVIINLYNDGQKLYFHFFFKKTPLTQWLMRPYIVDNVLYQTAEHYMMAAKARLFEDYDTEKEILNSVKPSVAKHLGRNVKNFDQAIWDANKFKIVVEGNFYKFLLPDLKEKLLATGSAILVEASPEDPVWGIQMSIDDPDIHNPNNWKGDNLLGFALMEVRNELLLLG
jgi:ribA/ribD-fused uncharacterized protein